MIRQLKFYNDKYNKTIEDKLLLEINVGLDEYKLLKQSIWDKNERFQFIKDLKEVISLLKHYNIEHSELMLDWADISNLNSSAISNLIEKMEHSYDILKKQIKNENHDTYNIFKLIKYINNMKNLLLSQVIVINGDGATGKTHLLTKLATDLVNEGYPTFILYGHMTSNFGEYISLMEKWLSIPDFLSQFQRYCDTINETGLIIFDAINESLSTDTQKLIDELLNNIKNTRIKLIISYRNGDICESAEQRLLQYPTMTLFGFNDEVEAAVKFSEYFDININEILEINFQNNPLILKIFCEQYDNNTKDKGLRGAKAATFYYERFFIEVIKKIIKEKQIVKKDGYKITPRQIWDIFKKDLSEIMVSNSRNYVTDSEAESIFEGCDINLSPKDLLYCFTVHNILERFTIDYTKNIKAYRFSFQKFSDFLIVRYLLNSKSKNVSWEKFFETPQIIDYLNNHNTIIETLVEDAPPRYCNKEFFEFIAPSKFRNFPNTYIRGLKYRSSSSLGPNITKKTEHILKFYSNYKDQISKETWWDMILSVMIVPYHPLNNLNYTSDFLLNISTHERDILLHTIPTFIYDFRSRMLSLLKIPYYSKLGKHSDLIVLNLSLCYFWLMSLSDRELRDKATKAFTMMLINKSDIIDYFQKLIPEIKDQYIIERFLLSSYSAVVVSKNITLTNKLYILCKNHFSNVEISNYRIRYVLEQINIYTQELNVVESAYALKKPKLSVKSFYPKDFEKMLKFNLDYSNVYTSMSNLIGDFFNYIVKPTLTHFHFDQKEHSDCVNRQYKLFYKSLTRKQKCRLHSLMQDDSHKKILIYEDLLNRRVLHKHNKVPNNSETQYLKDFSSIELSQIDYFKRQFDCLRKKHFSIDSIQCTIASKILDLGYNVEVELLDQKRSYVFGNQSRHDHKIERLGKKYQWIAYYELLGECVENLKLENKFYDKVRLLSIDIDPIQHNHTSKVMYDFHFLFEKKTQDLNINWCDTNFITNFGNEKIVQNYVSLVYKGVNFVPLYISCTMNNCLTDRTVFFRLYTYKENTPLSNIPYNNPEQLTCYNFIPSNYEYNLEENLTGLDELRYDSDTSSEDFINLAKECHIESEYDFSNVGITTDDKNRKYYLPIKEIISKLNLKYDYAGVFFDSFGEVSAIQSPFDSSNQYLYIRTDLLLKVFDNVLFAIYSEKNQEINISKNPLFLIGSEYDAIYRLSSSNFSLVNIVRRPYRPPIK